jgi:hypothetical protein
MLLLSVTLLGFFGCGYADTTAGKEVEVSGKITGPDGQPVAGLRIAFQPTAGAAVNNAFLLGTDGTFRGKLITGKYSFFLAPLSEEDAKSNAILGKLPASWKAPSLDRQIPVTGAGELSLRF